MEVNVQGWIKAFAEEGKELAESQLEAIRKFEATEPRIVAYQFDPDGSIYFELEGGWDEVRIESDGTVSHVHECCRCGYLIMESEWRNVDDDSLQQLIESQANDEGLWFVASLATEQYLQTALRQLHEAVENFINVKKEKI